MVIAPKKVAEGTWTREKEKWDHTKILRVSAVLGSQTKRIRALNTPADIYIINRENVCWLVDYYRNSWPFDMVVIDESSSFKSHKAKRFKSLASVGTHIDRIVELTGTPSPNGLEDLWAQVFLLDGGERLGKRYTQFRERYFDPGDRGQNVIYNYKAKPGTEESILQKISDICISMKAEDYLQLPEVTYHEIPVVLDEKSRKAYAELERKMVLELPEDEEEISVTSAAALSNKLLQLGNGAIYDEDRNYHEVHNCKVEAFMELVESLQGKPALVFYNFQHDRIRLLEAFKKTKLRVRELKTTQDEDDWNAGQIDILLTHPASSAYGLNLQQGGNHVIWFGLTWNYELYTQANKRLHRQGQTQRVIIHHPFFTELVDQQVQYMLSGEGNIFRSNNPELQTILDDYFDDDFYSEVYDLLTGAVSKGFEYLYASTGKDGKTRFGCADSIGVVEVRAKDTDDGCEYYIYWYIDRIDKGAKKIKRIQVWDKEI